MKVIVVFEFENIEDPNSPEADAIVQAITEDCETMQVAFDASSCYVDDCVQHFKYMPVLNSPDFEEYDEFGVNQRNTFNTLKA